MKKFVTLLALVICNYSFVNAQDYIWAKSLVTTSGPTYEDGRAITTDASGNVYITGMISNQPVDFDPGPGTATLQGLSFHGLFLAKYDASGAYLWANIISYNGAITRGNAIALDASGNIYITGYHTGGEDFDPGAGTAVLNGRGPFSAKYDNNGNYIWANEIPCTTNENEGKGIAIDNSGNVYVTGHFKGTADFDPGVGTATLIAAVSGTTSYTDAFLAKYTTNGAYVWAIDIGGNYADVGNSVKADASGNVYVTGYFNDVVDFDPGVSTATISANFTGLARYSDVYFAKYDANGNYVWAKSISTQNKNDEGNAIAVDGANNVYVGGCFRGVGDFDPGVATATLNGYVDNIFFAKYDASGNYVWAQAPTPGPQTLAGISEAACTSLALDASNNVYITGRFTGSFADFDAGAGTNFLSSPYWGNGSGGISNYLGFDIFFAKYDSNGNHLWAKLVSRVNPSNNVLDNVSNSIAISTTGHVHITGYYETSSPVLLDFDPGPGTATFSASGGGDVFFAKYNSCPAPTITASSGAICAGETYSISVNGATTYSLNGVAASSYTVNPSGTTVYSVTGTSQACSSAVPITATVLVKASPSVSASSGTICSGEIYTISVGGATTYSINGSAATNFTVSPGTNTSYSVTGKGANGCVSGSIAVAEVTVLTLPVISAASGSLCAGGVYSIAVSGADTYSVNGSSAANFTFSPSTTTNYNITGTDLNGCMSAGPAVATITVHALPMVNVNSGGFCTGSTFTLNPGGANSYSINGVGASSFTVSPSSNTQYSITGLSTAGCVSSNTAIAMVTVYPLPVVSAGGGSLCLGQSYPISASGANAYFVNGNAVMSLVFNPTSTTTYSISGNSIEGCASSNTVVVTLTVNALPAVSVNNTSVCLGQAVVLMAGGADTYLWSNGQPGTSISVSPALTSTYAVTGTSSNGCTKAVTATVTVHSASISVSGSATICVNETAVLLAGGATTYTWSTNENNASISVSPGTTTTYSVEGTDNNGCTGSSFITLQVDECTGLSELRDKNNEIKIYPNPANDVLNIKFDNANGALVLVHDVCGKELMNGRTENDTVQLDISSLAKGVYFVKVGTITQKFVKE